MHHHHHRRVPPPFTAIIITLFFFLLAPCPTYAQIVGSGASFCAGLYTALSFAFETDTSLTMSYTALTSTKGKCRLKGWAQNCPVGDNDMPQVLDYVGITSIFASSEYAAFPGLRSFPSFGGGVVGVYNLANIPNLMLSRSVLARMFRQCAPGTTCPPGSIYMWSDPDILALNPDYVNELTAAGAIKLVVWADKAGTTDNWKNSMALWDSGFATQFAGQLNDGTTWPNVTVIKANTNRGVSSRVLATPGSIGYVSLDEAEASNLPHAGLGKSYLASNGILRASALSVANALMEKGLNWGNNGDNPAHLTANAYDATGSESWPIVGYTYFGILNDTNDVDCTKRAETLKWFEWFYQSPTAASMTAALGFAPLPDAARMKILDSIRANMFCQGQLVYNPTINNNTYNPATANTIIVNVDVSPELENAVGLYVAAYHNAPSSSTTFSLDVLSSAILQNGYPYSHEETYNDAADSLLFLPRAEALPLYQALTQTEYRKMFPLTVAPFGVVYNLCDARLAVSCDPNTVAKVDLVLTLELLARIMSGSVTRWNDPAMIAAQETSDQGNALPDAPIIIVGPVNGTRLVSSMLYLLTERLGKDNVPTLNQVVHNITVEGFRDAVSIVAATQYSLAFASGPVNVFSDKTVTRVARFWNVNQTTILTGNSSALTACSEGSSFTDRENLTPMDTSLYSKSTNPLCWPLVETYFISSSNDFGATQCYTGVPQATTKFMNFVLQYSDPLAQLGMVGIDTNGMQQQQLAARECFGESITNPQITRIAIPDALIHVVRATGGITAFFLCIYIIWVFWNRSERMINKSPWWYLIEVAFGVVLQGCSLIALAFQQYSSTSSSLDTPVWMLNGACAIFPWFYAMGVAFVYAPMLSRTWKVHRIFRAMAMREEHNNALLEVLMQAGFLVPILLVLALWTAIDPLTWHVVVVSADPLTGAPSSVSGECASNHIEYFISPLVAWVGSTMIVALGVGYVNRKEGLKYRIIFNMFSLTLMMCEALAMGIPILILTNGNATANFAAKVVFIAFTAWSAAWLLLLPMVFRLYKCDLFKSSSSRNKDTDEEQQQHSGQGGEHHTKSNNSKSHSREGGGGGDVHIGNKKVASTTTNNSMMKSATHVASDEADSSGRG